MTARRAAMLSRQVRFGQIYPWYLLVAAMDILVTWAVLATGGSEFNAVAAWAWDAAGVTGLTMLKFATVVVVVLICERIAELSEPAGRRLAQWAVGLSATPILFAAGQALTIGLLRA
ncbi:MAG: DUF5658 family protein [Phycisphaerales bacterium JB039]